MIILLLLLRSLLSSLRLSRDKQEKSSENGRERKRCRRESEGGRVGIQSENSLRIIIPQTIRSVIRVYLLWRMRDYDSGAVVYKRGKINKGGQEIRYLPRDVSGEAEIFRLSNFRARDRNEVEERTRENDRMCE